MDGVYFPSEMRMLGATCEVAGICVRARREEKGREGKNKTENKREGGERSNERKEG